MKPGPVLLAAALLAAIACTGCMLSSASSTAAPPVTDAVPPALPLPEPAPLTPAATTMPAPAEPSPPVRSIPVMKELKDSRLLFALKVPAGWNVSTVRLERSDTSGYRTDLVGGSVFAIHSAPLTRSREQEYRDSFRQWTPPPSEAAVTINGIRYGRFESRAVGNTTVAYLPRSNDANERGYGSVLVYTARDANRFEREDFEDVIASFRYFSTRSAGTIPGDEIPLYDLAGTPASPVPVLARDPRIFDSSDWDTSANAADTANAAPSDSSGGSHSGGGCHR